MENRLWIKTPGKQFFLTSSPIHSEDFFSGKVFHVVGQSGLPSLSAHHLKTLMCCIWNSGVWYQEGSVWVRLLKPQTPSLYSGCDSSDPTLWARNSTYTVGAKENIQFFLRIFVINMSWKDQYIRWHVLQGQRLIFLSYPVEDVLKFGLFLFQTFKQSTSCAVILIKCSSKSGLHTPLCTVQLLACCTG